MKSHLMLYFLERGLDSLVTHQRTEISEHFLQCAALFIAKTFIYNKCWARLSGWDIFEATPYPTCVTVAMPVKAFLSPTAYMRFTMITVADLPREILMACLQYTGRVSDIRLMRVRWNRSTSILINLAVFTGCVTACVSHGTYVRNCGPSYIFELLFTFFLHP